MIKKIIDKIWTNRISIIAISIILVSVLPMLYFFRFSVLGADDFLYGKQTLHAIQDTGSFLPALKIAFRETLHSYMKWQGSFSSIFLMYLQPGIISLRLYRVVLALIFLLGIISPCIMAFTLNKHYLKASIKYIWLILCAYIVVVSQYMPSIFQAHYWYNGTIYYQFTLSLVMLFVAVITAFHNTEKKYLRTLLLILMIIMLIYIGGSNYPIGLVFALAFILFTAMAIIRKYKNNKIYIALLFIFMICFLINVLAPGNGARHGLYKVNSNLIMVAATSIRDMLMEMPIWIKSTITLSIICALLPIGKKITQNSTIKFVSPVIAGLVIGLLLLAQYVPVEYGLGHKGPARVENIRFMMLNLGLWLFFINMMGYYKNKKETYNKGIIVIVSIILISIALSTISVNNFTSYKMLDQIVNGELHSFGKQINSEVAQFEDTSNNDCLSFEDHPTNEFLHPEDWYWFQSGIWHYYRKIPVAVDTASHE